MAKVIEIEIEVGTKKSLKSLNDLEQAQEQLLAQLKQTELGTAEYTRLQKQLKKVGNEVKDLELGLESLDKEQRAAALVDTFNGLAGAVTAVTGVFTLLGSESEELAEVEKRILGLIAVTSGLRDVSDGVVAASKRFGPALKSAFTTATGAVNGLRVAFASLGIGLVIAGVTTLIAKWDDWFPKVKTLNEELGYTDEEMESLSKNVAKQKTEVELLVKAVTDQNKSEKERRAALDELKKKYPNYFGNLTKDINDTETLTKQKDLLIDSLIREARVRAAQDKIAEIAAKNINKRIELQARLAKTTDDVNKANTELNKTTQGLSTTQKDFTVNYEAYSELLEKNPGLQEKITKASANRLQALQSQSDVQNELARLNQQEAADTAVLIDLIDTETAAIDANGGATTAATTATENNTEAVEDNTDAVKERIEAYRKEAAFIELQRQEAIRLYEDSIEELSSTGLKTLSQFKGITREQFQGVFALISDQFPAIKNLIIETTKAANDFTTALAKGDPEEIAKTAQALRDQNKKLLYERLSLIQQEQLAVDDANKAEIDAAIETFGITSDEANAALKKREDDFNAYQKRKAQVLEDSAQVEIDIDNTVTQNAIDNAEKQKEVDEEAAKARVEAARSAAKSILDLNVQIFNELSNLQQQNDQQRLDAQLRNLDKLTEARIRAAGDDAEMVEKITADAAKQEDIIRKRAFDSEKQRKIALAQINTAAAVLSILAETPKADFGIATAALIAAALGTSAIQIAAIKKTEYVPSYAEGGLVSGPGTGTSDSIMARISNGEYIVNAQSTQRFLPVLDSINESSTFVTADGRLAQEAPIFKTYVLAGDVISATDAQYKLNQKRKL